MLTFGLLHGLGEVQGAFHVDAGLLAFKALQKGEHAGVGFAEAIFLAGDTVVEALFLRGNAITYVGHDKLS